MRSKLGLAIAFVIALAFGTSAALANNTIKTQNMNSSATTTTTMKTSGQKRRYSRRRRHHRKYTAKGNSKQRGNSNRR